MDTDAAATVPQEPVRDKKPKKKRPFWVELPLLLAIALVLALVVKTFFVQAFSIPSESMVNTLNIGDRVVVDKLTPWFGSKPERGEVVVFKDPGGWLEGTPNQDQNVVQSFLSFVGLMPAANEKDLIKRVIAVGGDRVSCCDAQGRVMVNGAPLNETYLNDGVGSTDPFPEVVVPDGHIWVMGDNRRHSGDSRLPGHGPVDEDQVVGRAFSVVWPLGHMKWLGIPDTAPSAALVVSVPFLAWWRRKNS